MGARCVGPSVRRLRTVNLSSRPHTAHGLTPGAGDGRAEDPGFPVAVGVGGDAVGDARLLVHLDVDPSQVGDQGGCDGSAHVGVAHRQRGRRDDEARPAAGRTGSGTSSMTCSSLGVPWPDETAGPSGTPASDRHLRSRARLLRRGGAGRPGGVPDVPDQHHQGRGDVERVQEPDRPDRQAEARRPSRSRCRPWRAPGCRGCTRRGPCALRLAQHRQVARRRRARSRRNRPARRCSSLPPPEANTAARPRRVTRRAATLGRRGRPGHRETTSVLERTVAYVVPAGARSAPRPAGP